MRRSHRCPRPVDRPVTLDPGRGGSPHRRPAELRVCASRAHRRPDSAAPDRPTPGCSTSRASRPPCPTTAAYVADSPYALAAEDDGFGVYRGQTPAGGRRRSRRGPATTTSTTADGIPYWQIALLHLDSVASTVLQTCAYWGNVRPVPVLRHRRHARRRAHHRQEDPGDAGRGRGRRPGPRRRGRRDPDHRQHRDPRPRRDVRRRAAARRSRRPPACRCRCSSSRRPTST